MRVLHLHSGNINGGIERILSVLARRGASAAMEMRCALCFDGAVARDLRAAGVSVDLLGEVRLSRPHTAWKARRRLRDVLDTWRPECIVTHLPWTHAVFGSALRRPGTTLVQWVHGPLHGPVQQLAERCLPDAVICNSRFTRSQLPAPLGGVPGEVIYAPVEPAPRVGAAERAGMREEAATPHDATVVLQASRFEPWKGYEPHLRALATLASDPSWMLWIAGEPQREEERAYDARLRAMAAGHPLAGRVRFLGQRPDLPRVMAAADLYCQPNTEPEPFGLVFVEALAAGLPVVSTDLGGAREVVNGDTGILVPAQDISALAGALARVIADSPLRRRAREAGPIRARALCDPPAQSLALARALEHFHQVHA